MTMGDCEYREDNVKGHSSLRRTRMNKKEVDEVGKRQDKNRQTVIKLIFHLSQT